MNTKKLAAPLIIESHPKTYQGYPFITLIQYRKNPFLTIVDNVDEDNINAYVLDLCGPENINELMVVNVANEWYNTSNLLYPVSIEFSKRGLTREVSKIYRSYNLEYISRVIGPIFQFPMLLTKSVKTRKRRPISPVIEIEVELVKRFE